MSYATCDIQMLRGKDGEYVIKEFCVYDPNWDLDHAVTVGPPYSEDLIPQKYRRQNNYNTAYIHSLKWSSGNLPYELLHDTIRSMTSYYTKLYVKGEEKKVLLQHIVPHAQVINIEVLGCPKLDKLPNLFVKNHNCIHGVFPFHKCAALNAKRIGLWLAFSLI